MYWQIYTALLWCSAINMQCIENFQSQLKQIKRVLLTDMQIFVGKKSRKMRCILIFEEALSSCANRFF